jgi:hypothetical protein
MVGMGIGHACEKQFRIRVRLKGSVRIWASSVPPPPPLAEGRVVEGRKRGGGETAEREARRRGKRGGWGDGGEGGRVTADAKVEEWAGGGVETRAQGEVGEGGESERNLRSANGECSVASRFPFPCQGA